MTSPRRAGGFTLIELLVAITILAVVAVLGWRGLDSIVRARVALTQDLEQTRGLQLAFAQLQSDGAHIVEPDAIGKRPVLIANDERLTLVRTVFAENQPSRVQVVDYRVLEGVLQRRESPATRELTELDGYWQAAAAGGAEMQAVSLQTGVAALTLRVWVAGGSAWVPQDQLRTNIPVVYRGLEAALQLRSSSNKMIKVFLLGPV